MHALNSFFSTLTAFHAVSKRRWALRAELAKRLGYAAAERHADYIALKDEAERLYEEVQSLAGHAIRANLQKLGVSDIQVVGVLRSQGGYTELARTDEMLLSDLCALRYFGVAKQLGIEDQGKVSTYVGVFHEGKEIGRVDSDGDFDYMGAEDLRTAIAWKVATDGGRDRLIEGFDLDRATASLRDTIRTGGVSQEAFHGRFFEAVKQVFVFERTSRFADGYCGAVTPLWRVGTRELGCAHEGYPFAY